jgi:acetate kinase
VRSAIEAVGRRGIEEISAVGQRVAGRAVATTMGFTPMDGLMMATRAGALDPGIVSFVQRRRGLTVEQVEEALNHAAGLIGVSGVSSDYRRVEAAARAGVERARLALDIYAARVRQAIGSLTVTMGGVDVLVFTGGVGEHASSLRAAVCEGLECLGLGLDENKNLAHAPDRDGDADISARRGGGGRILIIRAQEKLAIAREVARVVLAGNDAEIETSDQRTFK